MYTVFKLQFNDNSIYIGCTCSASINQRVIHMKKISNIDWSFHYDTTLCKKFREIEEEPTVDILARDIALTSSARAIRDAYRKEYREDKLLRYDPE